MSRIFGESSKDKVSIIAANFFRIPEALASWVRQLGGVYSKSLLYDEESFVTILTPSLNNKNKGDES